MYNTRYRKILSAGALLLAPLFANAQQTPGRHPAYLHALSDLRTAQWILRNFEEPDVKYHVKEADAFLANAIGELDQASLQDGKNLNWRPGPDTHLNRVGRFREAMKLVQSATNDLSQPEDNPVANRYRDTAFQQLEKAKWQLRHAAHDLKIDRELGEGW